MSNNNIFINDIIISLDHKFKKNIFVDKYYNKL